MYEFQYCMYFPDTTITGVFNAINRLSFLTASHAEYILFSAKRLARLG